MKSIIEGKMYNTETATYVATYNNGCGSRDLEAICEVLYLKKTGEWFLDRYGGPLTIYAEKEGSDICGTRKIVPLSDDWVKGWLAKHDFVDEYIKYFGEPEE